MNAQSQFAFGTHPLDAVNEERLTAMRTPPIGDSSHREARRSTQRERILGLLRAAEGNWIALPEILALGIAQYNSRIKELRTAGYDIQNRRETVNGAVHSWYRLVRGC